LYCKNNNILAIENICQQINNAEGNAFWEKRGFVIPDESLYRAKEITPLEHI